MRKPGEWQSSKDTFEGYRSYSQEGATDISLLNWIQGNKTATFEVTGPQIAFVSLLNKNHLQSNNLVSINKPEL